MTRPNPLRTRYHPFGAVLCLAVLLCLPPSLCTAAPWGYLPGMHNFEGCFGLDPVRTNYPSSSQSPRWKLRGDFKVVMIELSAVLITVVTL